MNYYGSKISDNISETDEGYLICHNVPIARTGYQEYLGSEIPSEFNLEPHKLHKVYRSPEQVFSPATIASFEGKTFTDGHPQDLLSLDNENMYYKGHIQNVRQDGDNLIADIVAKDKAIINDIKDGIKREVSCGYTSDWVRTEKGIEQQNIRGNHLALVKNGRARTAVIQDEKPDNIKNKNGGKKIMKKPTKSFLQALGFKHFVNDAEPEQIEEAMQAMKDDEPEAQPQGQEDKLFEKLVTAIEGIDARLTALEGGNKQEATDEEKLSELEKSFDEGADSSLIESDKEKEQLNVLDAHPMKIFIQQVKPFVLGIEDKTARDKAIKALTKTVKDSKPFSDDYVKLTAFVMSNGTERARQVKDGKPADLDAMRKAQCDAMRKQNPHYKGGN